MDMHRPGGLMHRINDDMRARSMVSIDEPMPFFCECSRDDCFLPVWLTQAEYDLVVRRGMSVIVAGHDADSLDRMPTLAGAPA